MKTVFERTRDALGKGERAAQDAEAASDPSACRATGCPCRGTIDLGSGGRRTCSFHAWAQPDVWGDITEQLQAHRWLIDFIGEVKVLHARSKLGTWQAKARTYFAEHADMQPTALEAKHWPFYEWRLREDLAWRVGVRKDRPQPRVPQAKDDEFIASKPAEPKATAAWTSRLPLEVAAEVAA